MKMKNRDWEERLLEGPYDVTSNHIQIKSIRERVLSAGSKRRRLGLRWMIPTMLLFGIIACFWIFNTPFSIQQDKLASTLSNDDIMQIIEQSSPDPDREMLYKENVGNNGLLIFTNSINADRQGMTWEVGYINGLSQGWISGGETWIDYVSKTQYEEGMNEGFENVSTMYISAMEGTPFPILYGALIDPTVSQIRISGENEFQQTAKIIKNVHGGFSLWFTFLPDRTDTAFKVEYMDKDEEVIESYLVHVDSYGYHNLSAVQFPEFPKNENGQTYGSASDATSPYTEPDLIEAYGVDGNIGYVMKKDLDGEMPRTPEEALANQRNAPAIRTIPLYDVDGKTVIGEFRLK
jgi:hypothetical protein